jgi:hypothetical protein
MGPGKSTQHECDMERIMDDGVFAKRITHILEFLRLFATTSNTPLGEIARLSVMAEPPINEIDNMLSGWERVWLEQKHPQTISGALMIAGLFSRPLPLWLAAAASELIERKISTTERRQRESLRKDFVRALAVAQYYKEGKTWEDSYDEASRALKKTEAHGSEETMRASYKKIQKEFKEGRAEQLQMWLEGLSLMGLDVRAHADIIAGKLPP